MGYPPGSRGYRVHDLKSLHFFDSCNVTFDENIPYCPIHSSSSHPVDYSSLPFFSSVLKSTANSIPATNYSSTSVPPSSAAIPPLDNSEQSINTSPSESINSQTLVPTSSTISLPSPSTLDIPPFPSHPRLVHLLVSVIPPRRGLS